MDYLFSKAVDTVAGLTETPEKRYERREHRQHVREQAERREEYHNICDLQNPHKSLKPFPMSTSQFAVYHSGSDSEVEYYEEHDDLDSSFEIIEPENYRYRDQKVSAAKEDPTYETSRRRYVAPSKKEIAYHTVREGIEAAADVGSTLARHFEAGEYLDGSKVAAVAAKNGAGHVGSFLSQSVKLGAKYGYGFVKMAVTPLISSSQQGDTAVLTTVEQIHQNWKHGEQVPVYVANPASVSSTEKHLSSLGAGIRDVTGEDQIPISVPTGTTESDFLIEEQESTMYYSRRPPFTTEPDEFDDGTTTYTQFDRDNVLHRIPSPSGGQYLALKEPEERRPCGGKEVVKERSFVKAELRGLSKHEKGQTTMRKLKELRQKGKGKEASVQRRAEIKQEEAVEETAARKHDEPVQRPKQKEKVAEEYNSKPPEDLDQYPDTIQNDITAATIPFPMRQLQQPGKEMNVCADRFDELIELREKYNTRATVMKRRRTNGKWDEGW
jgi:hypothetical protein